MKNLLLAFAINLSVINTATAQEPTLSIEELNAQIDARVSNLNPYRALLNDPDPARSIAAMEIMLGSGDAALERMATEFGVLSSEPQVRRIAVEKLLSLKPVLVVKLDGSVTEDRSFAQIITSSLDGAVSPDGIGAVKVPLGEFDVGKGCYVWLNDNKYCAVSVSGDGIFVEYRNSLSASFSAIEAGEYQGFAKIYGVDEGLPATIQLID